MFQDGTWAVSFLLRPPHRLVVSCTELMPMKQANNFRVQSKLSIYPSHFCKENYHSALAGIFFYTPQSTNFFSQGFVGTRFHCDNRHNQRRHNEVHAFLRALVLKAKIHPCCNDNFFVPKICCKRFFLDAVFKLKTLSLFPCPYPSKIKTNNENLNCRHIGS